MPFRHFTKYRGTVETDLGDGYVFDRCTNLDGSVPQSLADLKGRVPDAWLLRHLRELRFAMLRYGVVPCDISPDNVLFPVTEEGPIAVLIDGVGNRDFIPLATHCRAFARQKIRRKWARFLGQHFGPSAETLPAVEATGRESLPVPRG